jgi:ABC-type sugar transport system ATPase subunit
MESNAKNILELHDVSKSFYGIKVLKGINLSLPEKSILGLVGENGAGKSTMMNILGGVYHRDSGEIIYNGVPFEPKSPQNTLIEGIAFIHQELNLFLNLNIYENIYIANFPKKGGIINMSTVKKTVSEQLKRLHLDVSPNTIVSNLSMGQRQLVEIAKALVFDAKIIIFDEPTTSLTTVDKERLFQVIMELKAEGKTIIYISHILEDVFRLCDEIAVLRDGNLVYQDKAASCTTPQLIKLMVGRDIKNIYPTIEKQIGEPVYEIKNVSTVEKLIDVNLSIKEGEIVGIYGLMGAGRTELLRAVFGLDPISSGEVYYKSKRIAPLSPITNIKEGVSFISENRREEGLLVSKSVKENAILVKVREITKSIFSIIDRKAEEDNARKMVKKLSIKTYNMNKQVCSNLSGGNQQKVVLAKWIMMEPKVFLLDEPTRGVDVGAKYEIYTIINELAANKSSVLFVSSEIEELMGICDRILTMSNGKLTSEISRNEYDQEKIMSFALGGENVEQ